MIWFKVLNMCLIFVWSVPFFLLFSDIFWVNILNDFFLIFFVSLLDKALWCVTLMDALWFIL